MINVFTYFLIPYADICIMDHRFPYILTISSLPSVQSVESSTIYSLLLLLFLTNTSFTGIFCFPVLTQIEKRISPGFWKDTSFPSCFRLYFLPLYMQHCLLSFNMPPAQCKQIKALYCFTNHVDYSILYQNLVLFCCQCIN